MFFPLRFFFGGKEEKNDYFHKSVSTYYYYWVQYKNNFFQKGGRDDFPAPGARFGVVGRSTLAPKHGCGLAKCGPPRGSVTSLFFGQGVRRVQPSPSMNANFICHEEQEKKGTIVS